MAEVEDGGRRLRGVVRWFNGTKGYGFITPDDGGEDLFVHQSSIKSDGYRSLGEGETVEFVVEQSTDGRTKAVDVTGPDGSNVLGDRRGGSDGGGFGGRGERYGGGDRYGGGGGRGGGGYGFDGRSGRNGGGGTGACFNCGEMGHMARDCSQGGRAGGGGGGGGGRYGSGGGGRYGGGYGGGGGGGECFVCGEPGHFARECPNNSRN